MVDNFHISEILIHRQTRASQMCWEDDMSQCIVAVSSTFTRASPGAEGRVQCLFVSCGCHGSIPLRLTLGTLKTVAGIVLHSR